EARARRRPLPGKRQDPAADAFGDVEEPALAEQLESVEKRLADERAPDDDRLVLAVPAAAARVVEMIGPRVLGELRRLVLDEPVETADRLVTVLWTSRQLVQREVAGGHISAPFRRGQRLDAEQRTHVDRALSADLLQKPIHQRAHARESAQR